MSNVPFAYLQHLVTVPVVVNRSVEARFVIDSGIGLTILSRSLFEETGCALTGSTYSGKRMSGQEVPVPLGTVGSLALGSLARDGLEVGLIDMSRFPPELREIGGFLSLGFFGRVAFTIDYPGRTVVLETEDTLRERAARGSAVVARVKRDEHTVDAFLRLTLPGGRSIDVEIDLGSSSLILDESLAPEVGVRLGDPAVRTIEDEDETGHRYRRSFTRIRGSIHATEAPEISQRDPEVMFQKIIYDGLVGDSFLRAFVVTFDVWNSRMVCARP